MIEQIKPGCELEVDGGIDAATAPLAVVAGASVLVAGSSIFGNGEGVAAAMKLLHDGQRVIVDGSRGLVLPASAKGEDAPA